METFFAALSSSVQGGGREGDVAKQNALALHMVLSLLFTVCTRVSGRGCAYVHALKDAWESGVVSVRTFLCMARRSSGQLTNETQ